MGQIKVEKNVGGIEGLCVIEPAVHGDARGYFMETYSKRDMEEAGLTMEFVQDNQSSSRKGVLRGLHYQKTYPQAKLVRVLKGEVFDVAVDLRKGSETYGKWVGCLLSEENKKLILGENARKFCVIIADALASTAISESNSLAREFGAYPKYTNKVFDTPYIKYIYNKEIT